MNYQIILIFIILYFISNQIENFEPVDYGDYMDPSHQVNHNEKIYKNCCLASLKYNHKKDEYDYKLKKINKCKLSDVKNYHQETLLIDGKNKWNNKYCDKNNKLELGSCRISNFECKDFIPRKECLKNKTPFIWSDKSCRTRLKLPNRIKPHPEVSTHKNNKKIKLC